MGQDTTDTSSIHEECSPDEWNDGWSFDDWNDHWNCVRWHEDCEQTHDTSVSSLSLESSTWAKMNLDIGAAVNTFPSNFVPEGIGDGHFYDWIPDGEAWQFQGYDEVGKPRSLNGVGSRPGCRDEFRERVGTTIEKTMTGEASIDTCKDRIAETERVRVKRRARIERGAVDVPEEPGDKDDGQVAVRHADASGGYIIENQHEEKRMRDVQVSKRGSEATSEEQTDEWRKAVRFLQESPNTSASSDPYVGRLGSVLVQKSGHVEEKMPEIFREVNQLIWLRIGHISTLT